MNPFPQNCRYGKRYRWNSFSPDISTVLPDFQAYGSGYLSTSYTDAAGMHMRFVRTGSMEYPQANDIFAGNLSCSGDFEAYIEFCHQYIDYALGTYDWKVHFYDIQPGYVLGLSIRAGRASSSYIGFGGNDKQISAISDGNWHSFQMKKIGTRMKLFFDGSYCADTSFPGYVSTSSEIVLYCSTSNSSVYDFRMSVRNLRITSNSGSACLGGSHYDLLKA